MDEPEPRRQTKLVPVVQTAVLKLDSENILGTGMAESLTSQKVNVSKRESTDAEVGSYQKIRTLSLEFSFPTLSTTLSYIKSSHHFYGCEEDVL